MDNIPLGCYIKANELFGGKEQEAAGKVQLRNVKR